MSREQLSTGMETAAASAKAMSDEGGGDRDGAALGGLLRCVGYRRRVELGLEPFTWIA